MLLAGLTWVFAIFAIGDAADAMHFLFCICNSLQGFLIFIFLHVRERTVRRAWIQLFSRCRHQIGRMSGDLKTQDETSRAAVIRRFNSSGDNQLDQTLKMSSATESESTAKMTSQSGAESSKVTTQLTSV